MNRERSGFRDEWYSREHRTWGDGLPMCDLDAIWLEYDRKGVAALIETKRKNGAWSAPPPDDPNCAALAALAKLGEIPFLVVIYEPDSYQFAVYPQNAAARYWFSDGEMLDGESYVDRLYQIRGVPMPDGIRAYLRDKRS